MCGICGIAYTDPGRRVDQERLLAMRDILTHRGPDDAGLYEAPGIGLGARRLAILDLSAQGHMPMSTADGRYTISYNGEGFNYRELRAGLEKKGYQLRSHTDTEVILYLYAEEGAAMLSRLNGMFAIAIWDARERTLFLARDRMGVKPAYYAQQPDALYFASEQKALFAAGVAAQFDPATWEELLCFRYVAGERTPVAGVKRLLPGHYLIWRAGKIQIHRWWNLGERARTLWEDSVPDAVDWFSRTFDDAVDLRRISDVPVGVLLSGGLDSSCVAASLGSQAASGLASFTVRFKESFYDEGPIAQAVAKQWGMKYHELTLNPGDLPDLIRRCSWLNDEPLAHANDPHLFAISKFAKPLVSVLLSGEGADETLGGYVRYRPLRHLNALERVRPLVNGVTNFIPQGLAGTMAGRIHKLDRFLRMGAGDNFVLFDACDLLPSELREFGVETTDDFFYRRQILGEGKLLYPGEPMRQAMFLDQHSFLCSILDRNDRTTMGASIECRVPFLDFRLVERLAALPSSVLLQGHQTKILLRKAFNSRVPQVVRTHKKWGFGVPWQDYFHRIPEFRQLIGELPDLPMVRDGPISRPVLRRLVDSYLRGDQRQHALIRQLVFITIWHQTCIGQTSGRPPR